MCVRCEAPDPGDVFVRRDSAAPWGLKHIGLGSLFTNVAVHAPACAECAKKLRAQRRYREAADWTCTIIGGVVAVLILRELHLAKSPYRLIYAIGITMVLVAPYLIWDFLNARAFDITVSRASVMYEFRSPRVAARFRRANESADES